VRGYPKKRSHLVAAENGNISERPALDVVARGALMERTHGHPALYEKSKKC
jgi:hypothetical protein